MKKHFTFIMTLLTLLFCSVSSFAEDADGGLTAIPLETEGAAVGEFVNPANAVQKEGYTTYTTNGNISVIFKMLNVDVTDCDYILFKFANPTPKNLKYAFWNHDNKLDDLPTGVTEFKYEWSKDEDCRVVDNKIAEITLLTMWCETSVDLIGVYKHKKASEGQGGEGSGEVTPEPEPEPEPQQEPEPVSYSAPNAGSGYVALDVMKSHEGHDGFTSCPTVESADYITYTAQGDLNFAFKKENVDVTGCSKVVVKFAEAVSGPWKVAYKAGQDMDALAGKNEFVIPIAKGMTTLPQIAVLTGFGVNEPTTIKISGVYKYTYSAPDLGNDFIAIDQEQNDNNANLADKTVFSDYISYSTKSDVCVITKNLNVDVTGCDKVLLKFKDAVPSGVQLSYGGDLISLEGKTEYEIPVTGNQLSEITLLTLWCQPGKVVNVSGIYKHLAPVIPSILIEDRTALPESATVGTNYKMCYKRTIKNAKYQGLYVPYSITGNAADSEGITMYEIRDISVNSSTVSLKVVQITGEVNSSANTPLMFKVNNWTANTDVTIANEAVLEEANENEQSSSNSVVKGAVKNTFDLKPEGYYALSGGDLCQVSTNVNLPLYRWAVKFPTVPAGARLVINISGIEDEDATAIAEAIEEQLNTKVYSINGVEVNPAKAKGLVIKNGKKYLVK